MQKATGLRIVAFWAVLSMILVLGCSSGVAQKDYDAVKQQLATKEQEAATAKQQLQAAQATGQQATALQQQLTAKEQELTKAKADLQTAQAAKPVIWTKLLPVPAPAPTATPRPPGFTPVPAATPPPDLVSEVVPFTFYVETLTGHQVTTVAQYPSCVPNSQFRRGAHLVWRFEVFDTSTGKRLTSLDTPTIKVVLPNGEEKIARYSKRGGVGPWMWAAAFTVPLDYPLGTFDYQIVVTTKDGRTGTFDQDKVALVRAATATAAGIDSRVQIVE